MKIKIILDIRTVQASSPLSGWLEIQKSPTQKYVFSAFSVNLERIGRLGPSDGKLIEISFQLLEANLRTPFCSSGYVKSTYAPKCGWFMIV